MRNNFWLCTKDYLPGSCTLFEDFSPFEFLFWDIEMLRIGPHFVSYNFENERREMSFYTRCSMCGYLWSFFVKFLFYKQKSVYIRIKVDNTPKKSWKMLRTKLKILLYNIKIEFSRNDNLLRILTKFHWFQLSKFRVFMIKHIFIFKLTIFCYFTHWSTLFSFPVIHKVGNGDIFVQLLMKQFQTFRSL